MRSIRRARRPLVALVVLVLLLVVGYVAHADDHRGRAIGTVALSALPAPAARTVRSIEGGGDRVNGGAAFTDRAHGLPPEPDGYYRQFPVPVPGGRDLVVAGRGGQLYWTTDRGATFRRIELRS